LLVACVTAPQELELMPIAAAAPTALLIGVGIVKFFGMSEGVGMRGIPGGF
jgi:hypothetical protein